MTVGTHHHTSLVLVFKAAGFPASGAYSFPGSFVSLRLHENATKQEEILVRIARELPALRSSFSAIKFEKSINILLH